MQPNRPQPFPGPPHNYPPRAGPSNGNIAAQALTAALSNPYGQAQFAAYGQASHYAQAYAQYYNQARPSVTAEGYTLSSTYVPGTRYNQFIAPQNLRPSAGQRPQTQTHSYGHGGPRGWYQAGTSRCSTQGCTFTGSKRSVELHMMDRHLIYPLGWERRKKRDDWDADPSLKGKPVPIQGTSIKLDTPEAIAAWIAERKKRFPTAQNVAEKEQKKREAIERGQLPFDDGHRKKRQRVGDGPGGHAGNLQGRGGHRGRGRGRGRGRSGGGDNGRCGRQQNHAETTAIITAPSSGRQLATSKQTQAEELSSADPNSDSDSDSDGAPEVTSSNPPPGFAIHDVALEEEASDAGEEDVSPRSGEGPEASHNSPQLVKTRRPKQPRKPLYNPFAQRPSLLRNLLLPEIRMTVSNLSQAIRFLVDNDFLDNVELKPGQANERMIEVIGEQAAETDDAVGEPTKSDTQGEGMKK